MAVQLHLLHILVVRLAPWNMNMFGRLGVSTLTGRTSFGSINSLCSNLQSIRLATKKAGGSSRNGRDSAGKRLGVKKLGGHLVAPGHIIIRQRGQKYHHGENTKMGRDHTIYSVLDGWVKFTWNPIRKHQVVSVVVENPNTPKMIREPIVEAAAVHA